MLGGSDGCTPGTAIISGTYLPTHLFKWGVLGGSDGCTPGTAHTGAVVYGPFGLPLFDWCKFGRRHLGDVLGAVPPSSTAVPSPALRRTVVVEIVVEGLRCFLNLNIYKILCLEKDVHTFNR